MASSNLTAKETDLLALLGPNVRGLQHNLVHRIEQSDEGTGTRIARTTCGTFVPERTKESWGPKSRRTFDPVNCLRCIADSL